MKRVMILLLVLAMLLSLAGSAMADPAEGPACLIPTNLIRQFIRRLPEAFSMMANADPAGATVKYMLSNPGMTGDGIQFSNEDGTVRLEAKGGTGYNPTAPANNVTFSVARSVMVFDSVPLKTAFLGAVSDLDTTVRYEDLVAWMPGASETTGKLSLNGCTLIYDRSDEWEELTLVADGAVDLPAETRIPAATEAPATTAPAPVGELPECFIPQTAAQHFNGMLGPMLEMLGAPDPGDLAERFTLTKAQIDGNVLYLTNAEGTLELNALFEDGQPAVDKRATTLGIAMANSLDRSEMLSIGATFSYIVADLDGTVKEFEPMLDWMSGAVDGGVSAVMPMNGYVLAYAKAENGHVFTLVPDGTAVKAEPTIEPTSKPTPKPTPEPTSVPDLPSRLDGAVLNWNGISIAPLKYEIHNYRTGDSSLWLYFRVLNNTNQLIHVQANDLTVNGEDVYGGTLGTYDPYTDTGSDTDDFFLIMPKSSNEAAGALAIANASRVKMTLVVKNENYDRLCSEKISIDLDDLKGKRDKPVATKDPYSSGRQTGGDGYRTLSQGDKGDDVKRLQEKLIQLGYLSGVADGKYGSKTAAAVQALNEANGLGSSRSADSVTQDMVFSGLAKAYTEPWIPVDLAYLQWRKITAEGASYRVKITNTSKTRTIKGVALQYYVTDVWGKKLWGSTIYREFTNTSTIKPGQTKYSLWWYMSPSWYSIDQVHVRVARVAFSDGETHENYDNDYDACFNLH